MCAHGCELFAFWPAKTIMTNVLYFRKKEDQDQFGLLTIEMENIIPAPSDAFLFSLEWD